MGAGRLNEKTIWAKGSGLFFTNGLNLLSKPKSRVCQNLFYLGILAYTLLHSFVAPLGCYRKWISSEHYPPHRHGDYALAARRP